MNKTGVENPAALDLMTFDPHTDSVVLVMTEMREWDGSDERLFQVQEKLNAYLSFALDGEMLETYPDAKGKRIVIQLGCSHEPDLKSLSFLKTLKMNLEKDQILFRVKLHHDDGNLNLIG
ncbi:MAG: DUF6572 domain-containing protein [Verrucomicrobiota bacterium]|nr:DUF6572 domain-containing protein [Verrucomicrobiota bacterium]